MKLALIFVILLGALFGKEEGIFLKKNGDDDVHTYRIPGLATTNKGTLIAVYDLRHRSSRDLPGDIDVGMSRSTDGGLTWESTKTIIDMGNDPDQEFDGVGDPCVLVDRKTNTIWVAGTWSHGNRSWNGSGPGMSPDETGQLILVKSEDDGSTWSPPVNITKQIKNPEWRFVLQGPGKGITMRDGTLVFPMQFRARNEPPESGKPFSSLMFSKDHGKNWTMGAGVKIDTTEAQVVELADGRLMINCRDNRGGSRSVYTTEDLGKTWVKHPSSRKALPEPVCMASLIRLEHANHGPLLVFSNPNHTKKRVGMTIKVSRDEGMTWPDQWHTLVDPGPSMYSCLSRIDDDHVGLLYENGKGLMFRRFSLDELLSTPARLLFEDDFNRNEQDDSKEEIGLGWSSNSKKRAKGNKQVDLQEEAMVITCHPEADHAVSVVHPAGFRDGIITAKFLLPTAGDSIGFNFADLKFKEVHAGHLCMVRINPKSVQIIDLKTGSMAKKIRAARLEGTLTDEQKKMLLTKTKRVSKKIAPGQWHNLEVSIRGDVMSVAVNGQKADSFSSEGIGHKIKRTLRISVPKKASIDDLKIYSFD